MSYLDEMGSLRPEVDNGGDRRVFLAVNGISSDIYDCPDVSKFPKYEASLPIFLAAVLVAIGGLLSLPFILIRLFFLRRKVVLRAFRHSKSVLRISSLADLLIPPGDGGAILRDAEDVYLLRKVERPGSIMPTVQLLVSISWSVCVAWYYYFLKLLRGQN